MTPFAPPRTPAVVLDRPSHDTRHGVLTVVHAGQTGVERGAHYGALAANLRIAGFMSSDGRDELGHIPQEIACLLMRTSERGYKRALQAAIDVCTAALIVVPHVSDASTVPPLPWVCRLLRGRSTPYLTCDSQMSTATVVAWIHDVLAKGGTHLLVTGPRGTRWADGEAIARRLLLAASMTAFADAT